MITRGTFLQRPIRIRAIQFDGTEGVGREVEEWAASGGQVVRYYGAGALSDSAPSTLIIETDEGTMVAGASDWIIRGMGGELYPCRDSVFRATYEPVTD